MKSNVCLLTVFVFFISTSCFACFKRDSEIKENKDFHKVMAENGEVNSNSIFDYESCVEAGGIILKSFPPKCRSPKDNKIFTKKISGINKKINNGNNGSNEKEDDCVCTEDMPSCPVDCKD